MNALTTINDRGQITIPTRIREELQLVKNIPIFMTISKKRLIIEPLTTKPHGIMHLAGSLKPPKGMKNISVEEAIERAKFLKAKQTAEQHYEL